MRKLRYLKTVSGGTESLGTFEVDLALAANTPISKIVGDVDANSSSTAYPNFYSLYVETQISSAVALSGKCRIYGIKARIVIEGSGTTLSSTGAYTAIEARYVTDDVDGIAASNGMHCAITAWLEAGTYYTISGAADYCGLAILDNTDASATIAVTKYSGLLIGGVHGGAGNTMGNAIKVGSHITNFLEIRDDDAIASLDGNTDSATDPDGFIRISIGGQPCWLWVYRSNPLE